ncbi:MBL fold metallo-hydrolase [Nocardioides zeae]|uniref:MBL fold metallo-hydrolase n=1 Tax=Nocardioides imazamoxiresistens TaxID=3231893 RepID=A0ABU3Q2X7_9ACTN|nr:MBL fold metallo-hydrolase [Nocardioides zeae]MDT9595407.1 MBL fold metallo-hydrolase [Nocardioides zeae]
MSTADAVSPDSDRPWADPGAWPVAPGVHRIPLPLPNDGLRAVNVYAVETDEPDGSRGITLVDGGWAIESAAELLASSLAGIGAGVADVRRVLVTHVHRDHYTQAVALRRLVGAEVRLGRGEETSLRMSIAGSEVVRDEMVAHLRDAGAEQAAVAWEQAPPGPTADTDFWELPDRWLEPDEQVRLGDRVLDAVATPGHTAGHVVFADTAEGLLFAGDHVLPTITPSIGFEPSTRFGALGDFMGSLARVRELPDLRLLPAHGPLAPSAHARVDELLAHHDERLALSLEPLEVGGEGLTAREVAAHLPWTRHARAYSSLDPFNSALAAMETRAHLEVLVARGQAVVERGGADGSDPLGAAPARYRRV